MIPDDECHDYGQRQDHSLNWRFRFVLTAILCDIFPSDRLFENVPLFRFVYLNYASFFYRNEKKKENILPGTYTWTLAISKLQYRC